ncbi:DNA polymerase [Streptococcus sp. KHUD_013]|uniref:DNA polymerase n=1 Tax=Streptococcus sp. KHUD_013 TaxID=3413147 RepID=UPI00403FD29D
MKTLSIDIETYSDVDLTKCGVYRYVDSLAFEILLFAYKEDEKETQVVDLAQGEQIPEEIRLALLDDAIIKTAFNANFERVCLSKLLGKHLSANSWSCTAVLAASLGLPLSLEGVGRVLNIKEQKMKEGARLIRYFCLPCKATKANGMRKRNFPHHAPEDWELFKSYCKQDVEVEQAIRVRLRNYPLIESEQFLYQLDQEINDRGIEVDQQLVEQAILCDLSYKEQVTKRAYELSGLENPNSVSQLKVWLKEQGIFMDSLGKKYVTKQLKEADGEVLEMLKLRLLMSKTSVKKYQAIERCVCSDGRVHGLLQFYGANRTGRWAGRLVQVQNLPQNKLKDLSLARSLVKEGPFETLDTLYDNVPSVLSELIRTAFVPKAGYQFIVADFAAIEARVLAWLSGESWRLEVFEQGGDIYCASASSMFGVPVEKHGINSHLRQKGKIAELALGYGGSVGALTAMGALDMGLEEEELQPLVNQWRSANPHIVTFWWEIDKVAKQVYETREPKKIKNLVISYQSGMLFITLPSGRKLAYVKPRMGMNAFGKLGLTYEGIGESKKWTRLETYGPKLVENIVQGIARDLLAYGMMQLKQKGLAIVLHVHDEAVVEVREGSVAEVCQLLATKPDWAEGLPLRADGYACEFYKKD